MSYKHIVNEDGSERIEDFACCCGESGATDMAALMEEVRTQIGGEPELFLTRIIHGLRSMEPHSVYIDRIDADQWLSVTASTASDYGEPYTKVVFYIQCDAIEHGIAMLWKHVNNRFPQEEAS